MRRGLRSTARVLPLCGLLGLALAGCGPQVNDRLTPAPGGAGAPPGTDPHGQHLGTSAAELEIRLEALATKRDAAMHDAMSDVEVCEDLCSLATSICEVAKRLEVIANRNAGNESYQQLSREAQLECREAMESCTNCVGGFENQGPPQPDAPVTEPQE
jgi:hypothetical protein